MTMCREVSLVPCSAVPLLTRIRCPRGIPCVDCMHPSVWLCCDCCGHASGWGLPSARLAIMTQFTYSRCCGRVCSLCRERPSCSHCGICLVGLVLSLSVISLYNSCRYSNGQGFIPAQSTKRPSCWNCECPGVWGYLFCLRAEIPVEGPWSQPELPARCGLAGADLKRCIF